MIATDLGFTLAEIRKVLAGLPDNRTPTVHDWTRIGEAFRAELDRRITVMQRLRDRLDGCIGCGCLSLATCRLHNPDDEAAEGGAGPRLVRE
jgi:MerR family redox-sensitive transcriptional activator SoxR